MASAKPKKPTRVCGNCYHEYACFYAMGGCNLTNTGATNCVNYETLTDILDKHARVFGWEKIRRTDNG